MIKNIFSEHNNDYRINFFNHKIHSEKRDPKPFVRQQIVCK